MRTLAGKLRQKSRRVTGPRQAILEILRRHRHPLTIKDIFSQLPRGKVDLATIYRSMHLLQDMKLVKKFDFGDGTARFEMVAEGEQEHHHHLVCKKCTSVVEIDECFPAELEKRIASVNGYSGVTHTLEFFGTCPKCQKDTL